MVVYCKDEDVDILCDIGCMNGLCVWCGMLVEVEYEWRFGRDVCDVWRVDYGCLCWLWSIVKVNMYVSG